MTTEDFGRQQAKAQMESIAQMVAAIDVDYDRLFTLREEMNGINDGAMFATDGSTPDEVRDELAKLESAAGDCESQDDAYSRLQDDPLSAEVRSGWQSFGETLEASEFRIVLCTGGPHVELRGAFTGIVGDTPDGVERVRMLYQDWGTPLTEYFDVDHEALETYARLVLCID